MGRRILIVDDDPSVMRTAMRLLETAGYSVKTAFNGQAAIDELGRPGNDVDLVLLDVMMPEMDGRTAYIAIKRRHPALKVIFLSAVQPPPDVLKHAMSQGHAGWIEKPFGREKLLQSVKQALGE